MVCDRCKMAVHHALEKSGLHPQAVELGEVTITEEPDEDMKTKISQSLHSLGFELIDDRKHRMTERIKTIIVELVHYPDQQLKINLSDHISAKLHLDYNYLSNLFSEAEGTTIEKYFIAQKIEKVKELLNYDELSINEIASALNYSSAAYLSSQFKAITGITPSQFKNLKYKNRMSLDKV